MSRSVKKYSDWASRADDVDTSFSTLVDKYSEINIKDDSEAQYANFDVFLKKQEADAIRSTGNGEVENDSTPGPPKTRVTVIEKVLDQDDKENCHNKGTSQKHKKKKKAKHRVYFEDDEEKPSRSHHKKKKKKDKKKKKAHDVDELPTVTETRFTKQEVPILITPNGSQILQTLNGNLIQTDNNVFSSGPIILSDDIDGLTDMNFVQTLGGTFIPLVTKESQVLTDGLQSVTLLDSNVTDLSLPPSTRVSNLETFGSNLSFSKLNSQLTPLNSTQVIPLQSLSTPALPGYKRTTITTTTRQIDPPPSTLPSIIALPTFPQVVPKAPTYYQAMPQTIPCSLPYGATPVPGAKVTCYSLGTNPPFVRPSNVPPISTHASSQNMYDSRFQSYPPPSQMPHAGATAHASQSYPYPPHMPPAGVSAHTSQSYPPPAHMPPAGTTTHTSHSYPPPAGIPAPTSPQSHPLAPTGTTVPASHPHSRLPVSNVTLTDVDQAHLSNILTEFARLNEPNDFRRALLRRLQQFGSVCGDIQHQPVPVQPSLY